MKIKEIDMHNLDIFSRRVGYGSVVLTRKPGQKLVINSNIFVSILYTNFLSQAVKIRIHSDSLLIIDGKETYDFTKKMYIYNKINIFNIIEIIALPIAGIQAKFRIAAPKEIIIDREEIHRKRISGMWEA